MPDHVHLMIVPDTEQAAVTSFLQALKRPVSVKALQRWRQLNADILSRVTDAKGKQHFWQQGGGYDRNISSSEELEEKINYIHQNPIRRGLVNLANDWKWSSAGYYTTGQYDGPPINPIQI